MQKILRKKIHWFLGLSILSITTIISIALITNSANGYTVQYGGRILTTVDITICSNSNTCASCNLCGCGTWYNVNIQPAGGSGSYCCPTFQATKGNNPTYQPGGYIITGGSDPHTLDANNTGTSLGKIKGNIMLAWFKLLDLLS